MAATKLGVFTQPSGTYVSESVFAQQPVFVLQDAGGATVTGQAANVTVAIKSGTGAGSELVGTLTVAVNTVTGRATFTDVGVNGWASTTLTATSAGLTSIDTTASTATGTRDKKAELPRSVPVTTYPASPTVFTETAATLQARVNTQAAVAGATNYEIRLADGEVFTGTLTLPVQVGSGIITLRPTTMPCAEGTRAQPSMFTGSAGKLATVGAILSIGTVAGASNYRIAGLEIAGSYATFIQIAEPGGTTSIANMPSGIILDRCYIHGSTSLVSTRAIELNGKNCAVIDSYIADIHGNTGDEQAIAGWSGNGPYLIQNNYLEAGGEIILIGGADTANATIVPGDITVRGNHIRKPVAWQTTDPTQLTYSAGSWHAKNLFELKNCVRVLGEGNVMENSIGPGQYGVAWAISSVNQGAGAAVWSGVRDVTMRKNVVRNMGSAMSLSGINQGPAKTMRRVSIHDNVFAGINTSPYTDIANPVNGCMVIGAGIMDMDLVHDTIVGTPLNGTRAITFADGAGVQACPRSNFDDNIIQAGGSGIQGDGHVYGDAVTTYLPDATFAKNVLWELDQANVASFPVGSYYPAAVASVGFADVGVFGTRVRSSTVAQLLAALTLTAASAYHNGATDGVDIGADMSALATAVLGVVVAGEGTLLDAYELLAVVVTPTLGTTLAFTTQPVTFHREIPLSPAPVVTVRDDTAAPVPTATPVITLSLIRVDGTGEMSGTLSVPATAGAATYPDLVLQTVVGTFRLKAEAPGFAPVLSQPLNLVEAIPTAASTPYAQGTDLVHGTGLLKR